jgi:dTDP-4-dehydrorhamnose reductase
MNILLLGKNGQVGWELQRALAPLGTLVTLDRHDQKDLCGDLTNLDGLQKTLKTLSPDIIVNAAGYTAVDQAENDYEIAHCVNALAPSLIAQAASNSGALLIHYSTDYVFNGNGTHSWKEDDIALPLNAYGQSKLQGEQLIQQSGCDHFIFRTSWVYGRHGNNFIKTIMRLAHERDELNIVCDQIGAPTGAELLADVTAHAIRLLGREKQLSGIYHLAPQGQTSWFDYALFIIEQAKKSGIEFKLNTINPIVSSDYKTIATRPLNSRLDTGKLSETFDLYLPDWHLGVNRVVSELLGK